MVWDGEALTIRLDEIAVPFPKRIRGTLRLVPKAFTQEIHALNPDGAHLWWPIAPVSRVEVSLDAPSLQWAGNAYFDHNRGDTPIAAGFRTWTWSRAALKDGAAVFYDGLRKDGSHFALARTFDRLGNAVPLEMPPATQLKSSKWLIPRTARSDSGTMPRLVKTLEDTPFYARSSVAMQLAGETILAVHESMSVDRFDTTLVQMMLPFRMPRRSG